MNPCNCAENQMVIRFNYKGVVDNVPAVICSKCGRFMGMRHSGRCAGYYFNKEKVKVDGGSFPISMEDHLYNFACDIGNFEFSSPFIFPITYALRHIQSVPVHEDEWFNRGITCPDWFEPTADHGTMVKPEILLPDEWLQKLTWFAKENKMSINCAIRVLCYFTTQDMRSYPGART